MASKKKKKEKIPRCSSKDVQIAYLMHGVSGVEKLPASNQTLRKALTELQALGHAVEPFATFVRAKAPGGGKRGRSAPGPGDERTYRAQRLAHGSAFLRLPVEALGIGKAGKVKVRFNAHNIIVERG